MRVTEPGAGAPPWSRGFEIGWVCGEFAWIMEPPGNGTGDEMLDFVAVIVESGDCAEAQ